MTTHMPQSSGKSYGKMKTLYGKSLEQLANGESVIIFGSTADDMANDIEQWGKHHGFTAHFMVMATKAPSYKVWFTQDEGHILTKALENVGLADVGKVYDFDVTLDDTIPVETAFIKQKGKGVLHATMEVDAESAKNSIQEILAAFGVPSSVIGFSTSSPQPQPEDSNAADWAAHSNKWNVEVEHPDTENDKDCFIEGQTAPLQKLIQHLNDCHRWTYAKIADWLDTLPNQPVFYPKLETDEEARESPKAQQKIESGPVEYKSSNVIAGHLLSFELLDDSEGINHEYHKCHHCGFLNHGHEDCPFV